MEHSVELHILRHIPKCVELEVALSRELLAKLGIEIITGPSTPNDTGPTQGVCLLFGLGLNRSMQRRENGVAVPRGATRRSARFSASTCWRQVMTELEHEANLNRWGNHSYP
jgi:hypothetical protein